MKLVIRELSTLDTAVLEIDNEQTEQSWNHSIHPHLLLINIYLSAIYHRLFESQLVTRVVLALGLLVRVNLVRPILLSLPLVTNRNLNDTRGANSQSIHKIHSIHEFSRVENVPSILLVIGLPAIYSTAT